MTTWRDELQAAARAVDDFKALAPGASGWEHADTELLVGLERWGTELAVRNRQAGVAALVLAAQAGFSRVAEAGGEELLSMGFFANEPCADGAPTEAQLMRCARWLVDGDVDPVAAAFDPSRQLYVWDDDLRPGDEVSHYWYLDLGQCCCAAVLNQQGDAAGGGYYEWPPEVCVGRGLVVAARGLRRPGADLETIVATFRDAFLGEEGPNAGP